MGISCISILLESIRGTARPRVLQEMDNNTIQLQEPHRTMKWRKNY